MKLLETLRKISRISLLKTIRMNLYYFGLRGLKPRILCAKNLHIKQCKGSVEAIDCGMGSIRLGFAPVQGHDDKYCRSIWDNSGKITIHQHCHLSVGAKIINTGNLILGKNFMINGESTVICNQAITFGDDCLISWGVQIMDCYFHPILNQNGQRINPDKEITIGRHCWIGSKCNILKGTVLPDHTIVASGSTITQAFSEKNCVVLSNRILKKEVSWQR